MAGMNRSASMASLPDEEHPRGTSSFHSRMPSFSELQR
jgi:hypothetical protein